LLVEGDTERTAWHVTAKKGNVDVIKELWEWAKKRLTTEELNQEYFISQTLNGIDQLA
jgi:hypothetical protein